MAFITVPCIISCIDNSIDISVVFNVNEEESSSKSQLNLEFNFEEQKSNYASIHYLQKHTDNGDFYTESYPIVFLDVISPPPQIA